MYMCLYTLLCCIEAELEPISDCETGAARRESRRSAESGFAVPLDASADPHHVGARRVDFPSRDAHQLSPRLVQSSGPSGSPSEKKSERCFSCLRLLWFAVNTKRAV
jgi:hypothetical protein